jgi:uncharacterized protein (DUF983 family)
MVKPVIALDNLPVRPGVAVIYFWLFMLSKEVWEIPVWAEVAFWVLFVLLILGMLVKINESRPVDIFAKWKEEK